VATTASVGHVDAKGKYKGAGFHDLRRFAGSLMVTEGVDVRTAQERLGHADPRVTLGIYAQATSASNRRAADTIGAALFGTRPKRGPIANVDQSGASS